MDFAILKAPAISFGMKTQITIALLSLVLSGGPTALANSMQVKEVSVNPNEIVQVYAPALPAPYNTSAGVSVYAGVVQIQFDGSPTLTDAFCIDPYHLSSSSLVPYTLEDLQLAPKNAPGVTDAAMGPAAALEIEKLWTVAYNSAKNDALTAAALQIAIWEVVTGFDQAKFKLLTNDSTLNTKIADLLSKANSYNLTTDGPLADLIAVSIPGGQDYVILNTPDGGTTLGLLGIGFISLILIRNRKTSAPVLS